MKRSGFRLFSSVFLSVFCLSFSGNRNTITDNKYCECSAVSITQQPLNSTPVCVSASQVVFTVSAHGNNPVTYQWQQNGQNIFNDAVFNGTNTPGLTVTNPSFNMNGNLYRCIIRNCNNKMVVSNEAVLSVFTLATDISKDGIVNNADFNLLRNAFNNSCVKCYEDLNADNVIDTRDFLLLLGDFNKTCSD